MNDYNFKVVIDAGHGGSDPGAVALNTREKDLTLDISNYMYNRFKELGVPVAITRTKDETLSPNTRVNRILNAFGDNKDVIVISNHINSNTTGNAEGAEVLYALRNDKTLAQNILNALGAAGQKTRTIYQKRLPSNSNLDYYFIHRNTGKTEPVIVEYGFINNPNDLDKLKNNYKKYADAVVDAVIATKTGTPLLGPNTYIVKNGDSLYKIAENYKTTVNTLKTLNNLTNNNLYVGQVLKLPTTTSDDTGNLYTVKNGDSLWKIAQANNTTVNEIKTANNLTTDSLQIGQKLAIPKSGGEDNNSTDTYTVVFGDSLWKIAQNNGTTVNEIKKINNLTSDALSIGQKLTIPKSSNNYIVRAGDSLWKIANKFNTSVETIKKLNSLSTNMITIGQSLKIPTN